MKPENTRNVTADCSHHESRRMVAPSGLGSASGSWVWPMWDVGRGTRDVGRRRVIHRRDTASVKSDSSAVVGARAGWRRSPGKPRPRAPHGGVLTLPALIW